MARRQPTEEAPGLLLEPLERVRQQEPEQQEQDGALEPEPCQSRHWWRQPVMREQEPGQAPLQAPRA